MLLDQFCGMFIICYGIAYVVKANYYGNAFSPESS